MDEVDEIAANIYDEFSIYWPLKMSDAHTLAWMYAHEESMQYQDNLADALMELNHAVKTPITD